MTLRSTPPLKLLLTVALMCCAGCGSPEDQEKVLATYRGGEITADEARRYVNLLDRTRLRTSGSIPADVGTSELLGELGALEILASEAEAVDETPVLYLDRRARLLLSYYKDRTGKRSHRVDDEDARAVYEEHLDDRFTVPARVTFRHVFFRADRHSGDERRRLEREVLERLAAGEAAAELARELSESESASVGGKVGPVDRGRIDPAFGEQVFGLEPETPTVIRTPSGSHVVVVLERTPERVLPFEEVKKQIVHGIMDRRNAEELQRLIAELRARYHVIDRTDEANVPPAEPVLRIHERHITRSELQAYLDRITRWRGGADGLDPDGRRRYVDDLITTNLYVLDAVERGLDREQAFKDRWAVHRLELEASAALEKRLASWKESLRDADVTEVLEAQSGRFSVPQRYLIRWLRLPLGSAPPFELLQRLEDVAARVGTADDTEVARRCTELGATFSGPTWMTPLQAAGVAPEFQRRLLAFDRPGRTGVFEDERQLFAIVVEEIQPRRAMLWPDDREAIRDRAVELLRDDAAREIKRELLEEHGFRVVSTDLFADDEPSPETDGEP